MSEAKVTSDVNGNVWQVEVVEGQTVAEGDTLVILECMKMEIPVGAPKAGTVQKILVAKDTVVTEGQVLVVLKV